MKYYLCIRSLFWIRLTRSVNICILLWDMMLGISPLLCTCQCLSTHLQPSLSCYLSIWLIALSLLSLSILIPHHSFCRSIMHICFLSLSLPLSLSLSLWWSNVPCVSLCSAVWSEWRVNTRERERERERETVCVVGFSETRGTCCPLLAGNTKGTILQLLPLCLQPLTTRI